MSVFGENRDIHPPTPPAQHPSQAGEPNHHRGRSVRPVTTGGTPDNDIAQRTPSLQLTEQPRAIPQNHEEDRGRP